VNPNEDAKNLDGKTERSKKSGDNQSQDNQNQSDYREKTGFGLGRDKSNYDLNYLIDDDHGAPQDIRVRTGMMFKDNFDYESS
jgi:hypothetical protein